MASTLQINNLKSQSVKVRKPDGYQAYCIQGYDKLFIFPKHLLQNARQVIHLQYTQKSLHFFQHKAHTNSNLPDVLSSLSVKAMPWHQI